MNSRPVAMPSPVLSQWTGVSGEMRWPLRTTRRRSVGALQGAPMPVPEALTMIVEGIASSVEQKMETWPE